MVVAPGLYPHYLSGWHFYGGSSNQEAVCMVADWVGKLGWLLRVIVIVLIIGGGIIGFRVLASFHEKPERQELGELPLAVDVVEVERTNVTLMLSGLGTVATPTRLAISPEVQGRIVELHPMLEVGNIVAEGEVLFAIDPREYQLAYESHAAELQVLDAQIEELQTQQRGVQDLRQVRQELLQVARKQLNRTQRLFEDQGVGTEAEVDAAQERMLQIQEQLVQLDNTLDQLPTQVATLKVRKQQVQRQLAMDELALERCTVRAPMGGRVVESQVELGQRVAPGVTLVQLVDDSDRELRVSLDGAEVARWLRFQDGAQASRGWFPAPVAVDVQIRWLGGRQGETHQALPSWTGTLDRLQDYDSATRTVTAVISIPPEVASQTGIPLVDGMFCEALIPGKELASVAAIPRTAVNDDQSVFLAVNGRLEQRPVNVLHLHGDQALIDDSLKPGEQVIVNRLSAPILGMKVEQRRDDVQADDPAE